jgi:basic amino acid/polyamine antiporter, APA family
MPRQKKQNDSHLFVRKATGLVRSWSVLDAFIYATFSINLVTLGLYIFSQMYYLQGGLIPTLLVSGAFIFFETIVYASLIAVMPRSGGDYVWQSRMLGGGIGFVLSITGWWFILWLWVPLYSDMFRHIFITPTLAILGFKDAALWFGQTPMGLFVTAVLVCGIVSAFISMGMKTYARIQRYCFFGGVIGLVVVFSLLAFNSPEAFKTGLEREAPKLLGTAPGIYDATIAAGTAAGAEAPLTGGTFAAIFGAIPFIVFFNLWPNWGSTLYGEVRGATDFKRNLWGMAGALIMTTALAIVFLLLINKTITWDFYMKANAAWWGSLWGTSSVPSPLPIWPYPALLAAFISPNRIFQLGVVLLMSLWWFGWAGTVFLSSTRVIFAASFDRLLPEKVSEVNPRTHTPVIALVLMVVPSIIVSALFAWNVFNFQSLTLDSTLVIAVTYLGSTIAAIILPYTKPDLYNASPIAKFKVFGIPLITVAGVIFGGFLVYLLYAWLIDPDRLYNIGLMNTSSIIFIAVLYLVAFAIYFGFKTYRKSVGIDIDKVHQEIPVE